MQSDCFVIIAVRFLTSISVLLFYICKQCVGNIFNSRILISDKKYDFTTLPRMNPSKGPDLRVLNPRSVYVLCATRVYNAILCLSVHNKS